MTHRLSYLWRGLLFGALAGFVAAEIVVGNNLLEMQMSFEMLIYTLIMAHTFEVIPATLIGGLIGMQISLAIAIRRRL